MIAKPIDLQVYLRPDDSAPFREWLRGLRDVTGRAVVFTRLDRVRSGNFGDVRSVGGGVSELRVQFGPGYRIYFGRRGSLLVILLSGGDKSSQEKDIRRAKLLWQDFLTREKEHPLEDF
jgi:putative addiction module killer protein